jgi:hypothetical protein
MSIDSDVDFLTGASPPYTLSTGKHYKLWPRISPSIGGLPKPISSTSCRTRAGIDLWRHFWWAWPNRLVKRVRKNELAFDFSAVFADIDEISWQKTCISDSGRRPGAKVRTMTSSWRRSEKLADSNRWNLVSKPHVFDATIFTKFYAHICFK